MATTRATGFLTRKKKETSPMTNVPQNAIREKQASPVSDATPTPTPAPPKWETAQDNLAANRVQAGQQDLAEARAWIEPILPGAKAGLADRMEWRTAPVVPGPNDDFPPYPSVEALLAHAMAQNAPGCPVWDDFTRCRQRVAGYVEDIAITTNALDRLARLRGEDCDRPAWFRQAHRWPPNGLVEGLANTLANMKNIERADLDSAARALANKLSWLLVWSRNNAVAPLTGSLLQSARTVEPSPTVTEFNPIGYRMVGA